MEAVRPSIPINTNLITHTSLSPIRRGFAFGFVNYKKGALGSQPHVIILPVAYSNL
jgi:hypothetical protein